MGLQFRRGSDAERQAVTFDSGEPVWTTDTTKLYIGDGVTAGGIEVAGGGGAQSDQALYTTSSVTFANITATNTLSTAKIKFPSNAISIRGDEATVQTKIQIGNGATGNSSYNHISIGYDSDAQGAYSTAIGYQAHTNSSATSATAIGIGARADGAASLSLGYNAGGSPSWTITNASNSIIINASNNNLNSYNSGLYVAPIRNSTSSNVLYYDATTKEITYGTTNIVVASTGTFEKIQIGPNTNTYITSSSAGNDIRIHPYANTVIDSDVYVQGNVETRGIYLGTDNDLEIASGGLGITIARFTTSTIYANKPILMTGTNATIRLNDTGADVYSGSLQIVRAAGSENAHIFMRKLESGSSKIEFSDNGSGSNFVEHDNASGMLGIYANEDNDERVRIGKNHDVSIVMNNTGSAFSEVVPAMLFQNTTSLIIVNNNIVPHTDGTIDLGTADKQFGSLYVSSSTIFIDGNEVSVSDGNLTVNGNVVATPNQTLNTSSNATFAGLTVNGEITANKLTIEYTTVTTTIVETDDVIKTTNATSAGSGVGAIVATAGGISATNGYFASTTNASSSSTGALRVLGGINAGLDMWVQGGDIRGPRVRIEEATSGFVKKYVEVTTDRVDISGNTRLNGTLEINGGGISSNATNTNLNLYGGSFVSGETGAQITLQSTNNGGGIELRPSGTAILTATTANLAIAVPTTFSTTATIGFASFGPNNSQVQPLNTVDDAENMLYFNNNIGGSLIFRNRQTSTTYRNFTISRNGSLILDSGASLTIGLLGAGDISVNSYFNTTTNVSGTASLRTYGSESGFYASDSGANIQTYGGNRTITFDHITDEATINLTTITSSTFSIHIPVEATTATITYTNIATEGQLRSQSTDWPFGENTATIMTIDTAVYGSARLNILVGATLGLDSHTERLTMDILTNGVDVLNAQSAVLATTSTGLCSYTAELSGTDILVKATALDTVNFLGYTAKTIAELVVKPAGGLGGL